MTPLRESEGRISSSSSALFVLNPVLRPKSLPGKDIPTSVIKNERRRAILTRFVRKLAKMTRTLPGTLEMKSKNRFIAGFTTGEGLKQFFTASTVPDLPQFTTRNVKLVFEDEMFLTTTHGYSGEITGSHFKFVLDNGPVIEGDIDQPPPGLVVNANGSAEETTAVTTTTEGTIELDPAKGSTATLALEDDHSQYFSATVTAEKSAQAALNVLKVTHVSEDDFNMTRTFNCIAGKFRFKFTVNTGDAGGGAKGESTIYVVGAGSWLMSDFPRPL